MIVLVLFESRYFFVVILFLLSSYSSSSSSICLYNYLSIYGITFKY